MKLLLKNCYVLCGHEVKYTSLMVDGDKIAYIGDLPEFYDEAKDMHGCVLMPGLINTHTHMSMTLVRGAGSGLALQDWLNNAIFPIEAKMKPEDIKAGAVWAAAEMLAGGTTSAVDMYDFPRAEAEALSETGMKVSLCRVGLSFSEEAEIPLNRLAECIEFVRNFNDTSGRITAEFCLHSEYLTNEKFVRAIAEANRELHANVNIHVSETKKEHEECKQRHGGLTPIQYFNECGIFENPAYAAHCVWVEDKDLEIMAEKGVSLIHNPSSNMKLGSGFADIKKAKEAGVNVGIGTDGVASNNNLNMFEEMHLAALIANGLHRDAAAIQASDIIDMATINGAKAMGRLDTGILEVGKKADIIAVSLDGPHMIPSFDILPLLVYSAQASDVRMTMVDGKILYDNGEFKTIDLERARYYLDEAIKRIW